MRRILAPTHDLCAKMRFVPLGDGAWDHERFNREIAVLPPEQHATHPMLWYQLGYSRFDLGDPAVAPYLRLEDRPETWSFRRLTLAERDEVAWLRRQGRLEDSWRYVFTRAVTSLEHATGETGARLAALLDRRVRDDDTRAEIEAAASDYSSTAVAEVGEACWRGSQDLTPQEKKA